jgi:AcrR family transcriptional regulator
MATQEERRAQTKAALLDAAADVVRSDGVTKLTLDRVAESAGVSKGGLLHHFPTKRELIAATLERTLQRSDERLNQLASDNQQGVGGFARAYLDYVRSGEPDAVDSPTGIFASAALDDGDLAPARAQFERWQDRLLDDGLDPTIALLARVVGDGLWLIDLFGLAPLTDDQRNAVIDKVEGLIQTA